MTSFPPARPSLYTSPTPVDGNLGPFYAASVLNTQAAREEATSPHDFRFLNATRSLDLRGKRAANLSNSGTRIATERDFLSLRLSLRLPNQLTGFPNKVSREVTSAINEVIIDHFGLKPVSDDIFEDARAFWLAQSTDAHYVDVDTLLYSSLFLNQRGQARQAASQPSDNNMVAINEMLHRYGYDLTGLSLLFFTSQFPFLAANSDSLFQRLIQEHIAPRARELGQGERGVLFLELPGSFVQHRMMDPLDALAIQHQIGQWGWKDVRIPALFTFMEMIALEPSGVSEIFPDFTFETEVHLATFEEPVDLEPLHHLTRYFQTPVTLARQFLTDYKNKIPSDLWDIIAQQMFGKPDMKIVSQNWVNLVPDAASAEWFLSVLLITILSKHSWSHRWRTAWKHFRGKGPSWKEKWDRLSALTVKILIALTLHTKYNEQKQEELLALKKKLKQLEPGEMAGAVEKVGNFFRDELMEKFGYFLQRRKILDFIPQQVLHQLEKLNALEERATHWHRKVRVDFIPRREILDAFFGVAGDNCTGKLDFVTHALSDPAFQPVRILVDGELSGSFMTYATVFQKFIPPKILGAHEKGNYETERRALIVSGVDSRFRFDPGNFAENLHLYLRDVATRGNYDMVLLPKYEGSQSSHDVALRKALQQYAIGSFTTKKEVYYPKRGPGDDPKVDYHPHSTSQNGYWVLLYRKTAEQFIKIENHEMESVCRL